MRLHKAKTKRGNRWAYGYPVPTKTNCYEDGIDLVEQIDYDELDYYIPSVDSEPIIPSTLCEFTGIHDGTKWSELTPAEKLEFCILIYDDRAFCSDNYDKAEKYWNGEPIYEYDVVTIKDHTEPFTVRYDANSGAYILAGADSEFDFTFINPKCCKVIGNEKDREES